jgi:alkylation response protein AidB-like acyl-CoA dehydrogenase
VNLILDEEHEAFRRSVRAFVEAKAPSAEVRRLLDEPTGYDDATWRQMADQLGLPGLAIPEAYGGGGAGLLEVTIVMTELGRALLGTPYLATAVIAPALLLESADDPAARNLLDRIASGAVTVASALPQPASGDLAVSATEAGDGWALDGSVDFVIDGAHAGVLLVPALTELGPRLFLVDGGADGLTCRPLVTLDNTRRQAWVELSGASAFAIGDAQSATRAIAKASDVAAIALAAEQLGGAERCLEAATEYAKLRHQFGRAIGSFQAVKHMCADMMIEVESARSTVLYAAWVGDNEPESLAEAASLAKARASDAFTKVAATNIQVHGGIGFTWEHDAHLYYRRANSSALLFGDARWHRKRLAQTLGLT